MAAEVLWSKLINSQFQCQCVSIDNFYGKLTVVKISDNTTILDKEIVLRIPYGYDQWENFCKEAINNYG